MRTTSAFAVALVATVAPAIAADHLDAPAVMADGRTDINDLYAFQSPTNPDNTVLIMTINPGAGIISGTEFDPAAEYTFSIDNTGDAVADVSYTTTFADVPGSSQAFTITQGGAPYAAGTIGGTAVSTSGALATANVFDDPFFFDLDGFNDGLNFTGDDFFAGLDVSAIVLEVPSSELGGPNIGVWATTSVGGSQIDRIGRPAINTVLIPSARKDEFNQADPAGDLAAFGDDVNAAITGLSDMANADALTPILLPDILTIDTSNASGFLNGRQLADDVIDAELTLLTGSSTPIGDGVDANDLAFRGQFPYLAAANIPEPGTIALLTATLASLFGRRRRI
ncbi:MAG: DUF4331 family protein [Planctomycetota bacterium]